MDDKSAAPTLHDIAKAAGVSVASVSKVLNNRPGVSGEARRRVLDIAQDLGYLGRAKRASRLAVGSVTIITLARHFSGRQFYEDVFQGMIEEAEAQSLEPDVRLLPLSGPRLDEIVSDLFRAKQPESVLLLGLDDPAVLDQVVASGAPAVIVNGFDPMMRLSSVSPDNRFAGWMATRQLLDAGHREIIYITHELRLSLRRRLDGFRDALDSVGIAFDPERHVIDLAKDGIADIDSRLAIDRALQRGQLDRTTAFFCNTDVIALGVLQSLEAHGFSVPKDYSVIGFDDVTIALHSQPPLTTMRIGRAELGRTGVSMLLEKINNPGVTSRRVAMAVQLIERATIGPPRSSGL